VIIKRVIGSVFIETETNRIDDASLKQVIEKAEQRLKAMSTEGDPIVLPSLQKYVTPPLWSDTTFNLTGQMLTDPVHAGVDLARTAKMFAAGFAETRVVTWAIFNTRGLAAYTTGTVGRYSESVRNPEGTGSGWAGLTQTDWSKLDVSRLSARALKKCVASINPVAVEPGRYTTILEPEAVCKIMLFAVAALNREAAENSPNHPYSGGARGRTKIGERIFDSRLTISTDPMDSDCPYIPFDADGYPYRPVKWFENGVLKEMAYDSAYALRKFGTDVPLPNPDSFRMTGGDTSIEEMIATTERGLLVTRFGLMEGEDNKSLLLSAVTRDGFWLIEKGKIKSPIKNMRILESPLIVCNTVLQLGKPERVYSGVWKDADGMETDDMTGEAFGAFSIVVPPMKLQDFNFVSISDAV
jgi:predicted Zn-dependent protease